MQSLTIDPPSAYPLPTGAMCIALCGCGGTGSRLAQALAQLAVHVRERGDPPLRLVFIDGDKIERKNVGRQLFSPAEVGLNKAEVLAARFSAAFGLTITALPLMATSSVLTQHIPVDGATFGLLVGAVDTSSGRKAMHQVLGTGSGFWKALIDCGNHEHAGQVVVGTTMLSSSLRGALALPGICTALPAAGLVYPNLLQPDVLRPVADCATAMQNDAQSLTVNAMIANIAFEYLYQLVIMRRIKNFLTEVDLQSLAMRTLPITAANVAGVYRDVSEAELRTKLSRATAKPSARQQRGAGGAA